MMGFIIGAPLTGWIFDNWGSYQPAWFVLAGIVGIATFLFFGLRSPSNLIAKYAALSLLALDDIFTVIFYVIRNKLKKELVDNKELQSILNNSEKWLKNLYLVNDVISDKEISEKNANKDEVRIDFDFPAWLTESKLPFKKFNNKTTYKMSYDIEKNYSLLKSIHESVPNVTIILGGPHAIAAGKDIFNDCSIIFNFSL